jgi:transposase-like protein
MELLAERTIPVDHVSVYRWVQRFTLDFADAARKFFARAAAPRKVAVITDHAPTYPRLLDDLVLGARQVAELYVSSRIEADHGRRKARLRRMRGMHRA